MDLLHCTSAYPCPLEDLHLRVLSQPWCDGLSDHSRHVAVGGVAVLQGAKVIEAHLRLDRCSPDNPDYQAAFEPAEFSAYVRNIRRAAEGWLEQSPDTERMLGDRVKRQQVSEQAMSAYRVTTKP